MGASGCGFPSAPGVREAPVLVWEPLSPQVTLSPHHTGWLIPPSSLVTPVELGIWTEKVLALYSASPNALDRRIKSFVCFLFLFLHEKATLRFPPDI